VGGCPPALGWKSLELFIEQVAPVFAPNQAASTTDPACREPPAQLN
jgi:hypothetical protein